MKIREILDKHYKHCEFEQAEVNEIAFTGPELLSISMLHDIAISLRIMSGRKQLEIERISYDYISRSKEDYRKWFNEVRKKLEKETELKKKYYKQIQSIKGKQT